MSEEPTAEARPDAPASAVTEPIATGDPAAVPPEAPPAAAVPPPAPAPRAPAARGPWWHYVVVGVIGLILGGLICGGLLVIVDHGRPGPFGDNHGRFQRLHRGPGFGPGGFPPRRFVNPGTGPGTGPRVVQPPAPPSPSSTA